MMIVEKNWAYISKSCWIEFVISGHQKSVLLSGAENLCIKHNLRAVVSIQFFKRVQNKIHWVVSAETVAEVIYHRADAEKDFIGLRAANPP